MTKQDTTILWAKRGVWVLVFAGLALAPFYLSGYNLSMLGRFLALGILGLGISLIWGYTGILSLGQGVFFGLGAYALALHLKLVAAGDNLPDFMFWNGVQTLPWWWEPFRFGPFALLMVLVLPALVSGLLAWLVFRRRITGVYVALITQALALAFATLLVSQQGTTGGFNGLTNFNTLFGLRIADARVQVGLYLVTLVLLAGAFVLSRWLVATQLGKLLVAIRNGENRVRFLGYNATPYKVFVFALAGAFAGLSGALFTLHVGVISPAMIGVVPSIEMVVWVALGGRASLSGVVLGTVLGNVAKDQFSSAFPELWLYLMGALFVVVVTIMPHGLAGVAKQLARWRPWATSEAVPESAREAGRDALALGKNADV